MILRTWWHHCWCSLLLECHKFAHWWCSEISHQIGTKIQSGVPSQGFQMWLCICSQVPGTIGDILSVGPVSRILWLHWGCMCIRSLTVGLGCCSRFLAFFAIFISTQTRTSPVFLGIMTRGDIHGVGPSTFSIISCLSRLLCSAAMHFLIWKGIRQTGWATRGTVWSMCNLTIFQLSNSYEQIRVLLN